MKRLVLGIILLSSLVFAGEYKYNGLYIVKKNGKKIFCEVNDAFYAKLLRVGKNGISMVAVSRTKSSPLIIQQLDDIKKVKLSDIDRIDIVGKNKGTLHLHMGTNVEGWKSRKSGWSLFNSKGYEKSDKDSWIAYKADYGAKSFLIDESSSKVTSLKIKNKTLKELQGKNGYEWFKKGNVPMVLFITYTVSGRHMDEGWVIQVTK